MATIKEEYVSFETAKQLKEKGFDWECLGYYVEDEPYDVKHSFLGETNSTWEARCSSAPTIQMTMKWLREVHNLCIVSLPVVTDDDGEAGCLWNYMISKKLEISHNSENLYESPETALNDAIKYCIENLI